MGLAPEERKAQALLLDQSVDRNITLASLQPVRHGSAGPNRAARDGRGAAAGRGARHPPARPATGRSRRCPAATSRRRCWRAGCSAARKLLLLDEPTRGVDVGARAELYAVIRRLADEGIGVLLVSSEVPEVLGLADRVLVMREGTVIHEAPAPRARRAPGARHDHGRESLLEERPRMTTTPRPPSDDARSRAPVRGAAGRAATLAGEPVARNLGLVGGAGAARRSSALVTRPENFADRPSTTWSAS